MGEQDRADGVLTPKVLGGRRIARTLTDDGDRGQEDHLDFRLPSRSNRTVKYKAVLRSAHEHELQPIPRQLQIEDTNAGGAAPAAAVSVPNREGAASGSAMSTEVALQGLTIFPRPQTGEPPRTQTREDIVHELAVVVEQRDRCRTLTGRNTADSDLTQNLYDYMREYGPEPLLYMPGEGILLRRVDALRKELRRPKYPSPQCSLKRFVVH